jgi:hypothetical protein
MLKMFRFKISRTILQGVLISFSCNSPTKDFSTYETGDFKEAFSKNKVSAYLLYTIENGSHSLIDSVVLNRDGTIKQTYGFGFMVADQIRQYDTLGRLIRLITKGDTYSDYKIEYRPNISNAVMSEIWTELDELLWITHKKYNQELSKILSETRVQENTDTIEHKEHSYSGDLLIKTVTKTRSDTTVKSYTYDKTVLKTIAWGNKNYRYIQYISNKGLIDSTVNLAGEMKMVYYYKYYSYD